MPINVLRFGLFLTLAASGVSFFPATMIAQENTLRQSNNIESISLEKINGEMQSVGTLSDKPYLAVIFLGTECPLVKIYLPKLGMISENFQDLVDVIGVNANSQDTRKEVNTFVKNNKISFPVYKDPKGQLATALGATRTPEALIINRQGDILYRGRIDDQYGVGYATYGSCRMFYRQKLFFTQTVRKCDLSESHRGDYGQTLC